MFRSDTASFSPSFAPAQPRLLHGPRGPRRGSLAGQILGAVDGLGSAACSLSASPNWSRPAIAPAPRSSSIRKTCNCSNATCRHPSPEAMPAWWSSKARPASWPRTRCCAPSRRSFISIAILNSSAPAARSRPLSALCSMAAPMARPMICSAPSPRWAMPSMWCGSTAPMWSMSTPSPKAPPRPPPSPMPWCTNISTCAKPSAPIRPAAPPPHWKDAWRNSLTELEAAENAVETFKTENGIVATGGQLLLEGEVGQSSQALSSASAAVEAAQVQLDQLRALANAPDRIAALPEALASPDMVRLRGDLAGGDQRGIGARHHSRHPPSPPARAPRTKSPPPAPPSPPNSIACLPMPN